MTLYTKCLKHVIKPKEHHINNKVFCIDLVKGHFQVCVVTAENKIKSNPIQSNKKVSNALLLDIA